MGWNGTMKGCSLWGCTAARAANAQRPGPRKVGACPGFGTDSGLFWPLVSLPPWRIKCDVWSLWPGKK